MPSECVSSRRAAKETGGEEEEEEEEGSPVLSWSFAAGRNRVSNWLRSYLKNAFAKAVERRVERDMRPNST